MTGVVGTEIPFVPGVDDGITLNGVVWEANGTSDPDETKDRWTEITIFKLSSGAYVVYGVGRSAIDSETDRFWMTFSTNAEDLVRGLLRSSRAGGKHLPDYARMALSEAAAADNHVRASLAGWESAARWAR